MAKSQPAERALEGLLFASRWLMAPFYLGLVVALLALLFVFAHELIEMLPGLASLEETDVILWLLKLIDLSLVGNLILTVMLAGYENFVSRMDHREHPDWPHWIGKVDFGGMKLKLIASIAAISAIHLLGIFMAPDSMDGAKLGWLIAIQLAIVASGLALAGMDYIEERGRALHDKS
ncbi:MAG TPA: TIGR00645 family protein [Rhizomicrobium sp.]|nr:TIGR00645 family protein [Rhizomicrobium sp.]